MIDHGYHTNYNGTLFSMINGYTKIHGELVPYFQTQPPWITCSQLPDTIMPGERAAHPAPTLVMKDPGRLGYTVWMVPLEASRPASHVQGHCSAVFL